MGRGLALTLLTFIVVSPLSLSSAGDSINQTEAIRDDGGATLLSSNGRFVFGFFSPDTSRNRYVGIWYSFANQTVVWVANRQNPIPNSSGVLNITADGAVALHQTNSGRLVWSTAKAAASTVLLRLLDSGNLVLVDAGSGKPLWQSFDNPTDTLLPTQKIGLDFRTGRSLNLTSWQSADDPSPGSHVCAMDTRGFHEIYIRSTASKRGGGTETTIEFREGPWNGLSFSGNPRMSTYGVDFRFMFVSDATETSYSFDVPSGDTVSRLVMNPQGTFERLAWNNQRSEWISYWSAPKDDCDAYAKCGPNGVCKYDSLRFCQCYPGFQPKSQILWDVKDFHSGCERKEPLNCTTADSGGLGFLLVQGVKLPDTSYATGNATATLDECRDACLRNCSCVAYAASDISNGTQRGCIMWFGDLIDTRTFPVDGQDLYLKVHASELEQSQSVDGKRGVMIATIVIPIMSVGIISCVLYYIWIRRKHIYRMNEETSPQNIEDSSTWEEVTLYDFGTISSATRNFCFDNKIGEGGFGLVYKGILEDHKEVAVKRLTVDIDCKQGLLDFMNEVKLIAKLQHKNLVQLIGCCIARKERILVYEYVRNKSLDAFIFADQTKRSMLDWSKRWDIILGIARGLVYLHRDSRLTVVHRDLKAANVLLDDYMNPKISDFGTARLFDSNQIQEVTARVVGTRGYMSPEYAMEGIFSMKSDVFSFGVLSLEIVSGMKSGVHHRNDQGENLLESAWALWRDGNSLQLLDKAINCHDFTSQVLRTIHVSLLCVEENPADRPTMSSVISMLESETSIQREPSKPWVLKWKDALTKDKQLSISQPTVNGATVTLMEGR